MIKNLDLKIKNPNARFKIIFNGQLYPPEKIQKIIDSCQTYTEFCNNHQALWMYLSRRNQLYLLDHLERTAHVVTYTKEKTLEVAEKCSSYKEFITKYPTAYANSKKYGIRDQIKKLFPEIKKPAGYWTKDLIIKCIKKHKTSKQLLKNESGAYFAMMKSKDREYFLSLFKS